MRQGTDLKGVVGAAVTPVTSEGAIDVDRLALHCRRMIAGGCAFTSVFGTTGEGASFSVRERIAALTALRDGGMDMGQQIPGVMAASVDGAAQLYRAAADLGCRAALIIPPFYYAPSGHEGVADFYTSVTERAGRPDLDILLYNFPAFSGVTFTPELVGLIRERIGGRLVGVKDSTGDLAGGLALIAAFPDLSIFTGDDRILSRMVAAGGAGIIGGLVNLYPDENRRIVDGTADDTAQAKADARIVAVDQNGGLVVIKALLAEFYADDAFARTAPPLRPAPAETRDRVARQLGLRERARTVDWVVP